jgi:ABC-type phosphate transport system substrate-binding protein
MHLVVIARDAARSREARALPAFSLPWGSVESAISQQQGSTVPVRIGGSSTVYPSLAQALRHCKRAHSGDAQTTIQISEEATTSGMGHFCQGQLLIAAASRPMNKKEIESYRVKAIQLIELPISYDAIAIVVDPFNKPRRRHRLRHQLPPGSRPAARPERPRVAAPSS